MNVTDQVLTSVRDFWQAHSLSIRGVKLVVGVSGGVDSMVLLDALYRLREELQLALHVATLDHGLRGEAGRADAEFVETNAKAYGLAVARGYVDVKTLVSNEHLNLEEAARQARYSYLLDIAVRNNASHIAVGHNRDDQAETVLMHIIRGSGMHGLRGMLPAAPLSDYHMLDDERFDDLLVEDYVLIRPLLDVSRSVIRDYAADNDVAFREDATNTDLTRFRNILRHDVLPHLAQLNPNIRETLYRTANVLQGEVEVLDRRVESVAAWLLEWDETEPISGDEEAGEVVYIDRGAFREQPLGLQRSLIRKAIFDLAPDLRDFSFEQTERVRHLILNGGTGMAIDLQEGLRVQVGYDEAMLAYGGPPYYPDTLPSLQRGQYVALDLEGQGYIQGNQRLITYWVVEGLSNDYYAADPLECTLSLPDDAKLALRTLQPGDRFKPFGMGGQSQKLSDTFTNMKVPAYYRNQVPLLTVNDEIAWFVAPTAQGPVGRIAEPFAVRPDRTSILRLRWQIDATDDLDE